MSWKIYEGYRLAKGTDIWEFTERLRTQGNSVRDQLDLVEIESMADAKGSPEGGWPGERQRLMAGYFEWRRLQEDLKKAGVGDLHRLDVTFIHHGSRILAMNYSGTLIEHVFTQQPDVEFFGWWDNTDPDENCTKEEWAERERTWKEVFAGDLQPPGQLGLNFQLRTSATEGIVQMIYRDVT